MVHITHKFFLLQILKEIYADPELASSLGFKGGTALMLFHNLPRFSIDLDFNLIEPYDAESIYRKIREILKEHGKIRDEAIKHYGLLLVLNYSKENRNLKVEIFNRIYPDEYELWATNSQTTKTLSVLQTVIFLFLYTFLTTNSANGCE